MADPTGAPPPPPTAAETGIDPGIVQQLQTAGDAEYRRAVASGGESASRHAMGGGPPPPTAAEAAAPGGPPASPSSKAATRSVSPEIASTVSSAAAQRGVDPGDANALMMTESGGNPDAVNTNKNGTRDHGLFQINDTNIHPGEEDNALDPTWNTGRGLDLYKAGLDRFDGDPAMAAYAYNHGMGAAEKVAPGAARQDPYVRRFMANRSTDDPNQSATQSQSSAPQGAQGFPDHVGGNYAPPPTAAEGAPDAPTAAEAAVPPGAQGDTPPHVQPPIVPYGKPQDPGFFGFMKALVQGSVPEVSGVPFRMVGGAAHIATLATGAVADTVDAAWSSLTGKETHAVADPVFWFDQHILKPGIERWTPKEGSFVGDEGSGAVAHGLGGAGEMVSYGRMGLPGLSLMVGNSFFHSVTDNIDKGMDTNAAMTDATVDALASLAQMKIIGSDFFKGVAKSVPTAMIRRVLTSIPATAVIEFGKDLTKKAAFAFNGNEKEANDIDLTKGVSTASTYIEDAIYSIFMPQHTAAVAGTKPGPGGPPPPKPADVAPKPVADKDIPPPPPDSVSAAPSKAQTSDRNVPQGVPDTPSAEPAAQIRSQLVDMRNPATPRRGVLISNDTRQHLSDLPPDHEDAQPVRNQIMQAQTQNRTVDIPDVGMLILKTKGDAVKARTQLKTEDPQLVVGRYTDAGNGKTTAQTAVVQGREVSNGAITTERAVAPDAVGAARQSMLDQGKIPIVTTPEGVIQERTSAVNAEKEEAASVGAPGFEEQERRVATGEGTRRSTDAANAKLVAARAAVEPAPGAVHSPEQLAQDREDAASGPVPAGHDAEIDQIAREEGVSARQATKIWRQRNPTEGATPKETAPAPDTGRTEPAAPAGSQEPVIASKVPDKAQEGMFKTDSGKEVPVHIMGEASGGKLTVRPLDDSGMPGPGYDVPAERVRTTTLPAEPRHEAEPPKTTGTPLEQLPGALKTHEKQEAAAPGRKNATNLKERQDNASAFATVLKAAASEARKQVTSSGIAVGAKMDAAERALDAASKAIGLTNKSKEATDKGQGTGHALITARVKEMHKAARQLLDIAQPGDETREPEAARKPVKPVQSAEEKLAAKTAKQKPIYRTDAQEAATNATMVGLNKSAHEIEAPGDVMLGNDKFISEAAAVAAVKAEVEAGRVRPVPFQIMDSLNISGRDTTRVLEKAGYGEAKVEKPAPKPKQSPGADKVATAKEADRAKTLIQRAIEAKPEDLGKAQDALTQHIHEVATRLGHPADQIAAAVDAYLRHVTDMREEARVGGHSDEEEPDDEISDQQRKELSSGAGFSRVYRPSTTSGLGRAMLNRWHQSTMAAGKAMDDLGTSLRQSGMLDKMKAMRDSGLPMSFHDILDHLIDHARTPTGNGDLRQRLLALRDKVPDVPTFIQSTTVNPNTFEAMGSVIKGMFVGARDAPSIQLRLNDGEDATGRRGTTGYQFINTILHEGEHAATLYETHNNPNGKMATQLRSALSILTNRLAVKYGPDLYSHINHLQTGDITNSYIPNDGRFSHLYGLKNIDEMMAELHSNPKFLEEVIRSEDHAQPGEEIPPPRKGIPGLLMKIVKAIADHMGYKNPELALHIMDLAQDTAATQSVNFPEYYGTGTFHLSTMNHDPEFIRAMAQQGGRTISMDEHAAAQSHDIEEERGTLLGAPKIIRAQGAVNEAVGGDGGSAVRNGLHALGNSKAVDLGRKAVFALKSVGQILRDSKRFFGHDDGTNPINQLRQAEWDRNSLAHKMRTVSNPVVKAWMRLSNADNLAVSGLLRDTSLWKIDPREAADQQLAIASKRAGFAERHAEMQGRYAGLSTAAERVFNDALTSSKTMRAMQRRAAVDTAVEGFDLTVDENQRRLLAGAKNSGDYDRLIGPGKLIDVGEHNKKLADALKSWVGSDIQGEYVHLGRQGEYVVKATQESPDTGKVFPTQKAAEEFAEQTRQVSPNSTAEAEFRGGKWVVDYKIDHVSFHQGRTEAEKARAAVRAAGYESPPVSTKVYDHEQAKSLTPGMQELMTSAIHKIERGGADKGTAALVDSLHSAYLQMEAQRSASAGSQLTRKGFSGVKAKDMRQNFADYSSSTIWHASQLRTMFQKAEAMARLRTMAKDENIDQPTAYKRGEIVQTLGARAASDAQMNTSGAFNRTTGRLGFLAYLTSPAHAAIWMTQNFTTTIPGLAGEHGQAKAWSAMSKGMGAVTWPAVRTAAREQFSRDPTPEGIQEAIQKAIASHPTMGKWADAIKTLHERGVISHGYANELSEIARGTGPYTLKVMDYARMLPTMADAFNRTSTALASLELNNGDLGKAADDVEKYHADYSAANKPRVFQAFNRIPGGNTITMMKTYVQAMAHLTYGNIAEVIKGAGGDTDQKARSLQAAKTLGGMAIGQALFAGVYGAVGLEPVRLLFYAYHKIFDQEGETWDMKNAIHGWLTDTFGQTAGNSLARGPIADALGVDVQERMGLANLAFHDPPDLLSLDKDSWKNFVNDESGALVQLLGNNVMGSMGELLNGNILGAINKAVPVKMYQDGVKALEMARTGKLNSGGVPITQPSGLDAVKKVIGLQPASAADATEKGHVSTEITKGQALARTAIIRAIVNASTNDERTAAYERKNSFNERNPGATIKQGEIRGTEKRDMKIENNVPSKNQQVQQATRWDRP